MQSRVLALKVTSVFVIVAMSPGFALEVPACHVQAFAMTVSRLAVAHACDFFL